MRTIRVSEIGAFLYCQRSWWYRKRGLPSENQAEMAGGTEMHYRHGRSVLAAGCLRSAAFALMLLSLVILAIYFTGQIL